MDPKQQRRRVKKWPPRHGAGHTRRCVAVPARTGARPAAIGYTQSTFLPVSGRLAHSVDSLRASFPRRWFVIRTACERRGPQGAETYWVRKVPSGRRESVAALSMETASASGAPKPQARLARCANLRPTHYRTASYRNSRNDGKYEAPDYLASS